MKLRSLLFVLCAALVLTCGDSDTMTDPDPDPTPDPDPGPQNGVTITYLHNDGVMISDGSSKVLIDALTSSLSGWVTLNSGEVNKINTAQAPYDDVDLILISHNHGDHYSPGAVNSHLSNNASARLIGPAQVTAGLSSGQIINVSPARGSSETITANGIEVEVLHLKHFDAFGNDFSNVQNFGYLINLGGKKILHLGDVEMTVSNLQGFGLAEAGVDAVLIPTFNTPAHLTEAHRDAVNSQINPGKVIGLHLLSGNINGITQQVLGLYPGATVFSTPLETFTLQ